MDSNALIDKFQTQYSVLSKTPKICIIFICFTARTEAAAVVNELADELGMPRPGATTVHRGSTSVSQSTIGPNNCIY